MSSSWMRNTQSYEIDTDLYSGPMDLLLDLIQKAELDISKLSLAQVTDQFLSYVEQNRGINPERISEFLVIASKLTQIKSEALLPKPPVREDDEEDLGETLAQQLLMYREIKRGSLWLSERLDLNLQSFLHVEKDYPATIQVDLEGITMDDLLLALQNLSQTQEPVGMEAHISIPKVTLRKKVEEILRSLQIDPETSFETLLGENRSRLNTIVLFLAILELVKQEMIRTEQTSVFSNIQIKAQEKLYHALVSDLTIED